MNEVLEFVLRLKDMMSGGVAKIAATAQTSFTAVDKTITEVQTSIAEVGQTAAATANQIVSALGMARVSFVPVSAGAAATGVNLQKTAIAAAQVGNQMSKAATKAANAIRLPIGRIAILDRALQRLEYRRSISVDTSQIRQANDQIERLTRKKQQLENSRGGWSRLNNFMGRPGGGSRLPYWLGIGAISLGAGMIGRHALMAGAEQQRDVTGMSVFVGAKKAQSVYAQLQQDSTKTPFLTKNLLDADRMLISTGMDADKARRDMLALVNAVAAVGGDNFTLERMALHMQQIATMGHAEGMQMREFGIAGINIYRLLSDYTGKHIEKTKNMQISYQALAAALQHATEKGGLYYGAMYAQSQTMAGKWSTLLDYINIGLGKIAVSQSAAITGVEDTIIGLAKRLPELAERWGPVIAAIVHDVITLTKALIDSAAWLYHNWDWLKLVFGAVAALRIGMIAFTETMKVATLVNEAFNLTLETGPWGLITGLVSAAAVGLGLYALNSHLAANKVNDNLTNGITDSKLTDVYADAGKRNADAYSKGFNDIVIKAQNDVEMHQDVNRTKWIPDGAGGLMLNPNYKPKESWFESVWKSIRGGADNSAAMGVGNRHIAYGPQQKLSNIIPAAISPTDTWHRNKHGQLVKDMPKPSSGTSDTADMNGLDAAGKVTGGGNRQTIININKSVFDHLTYNVSGTGESRDDMERKFESWFLRLINSANAAG